jgi:uncharacterized secreted protein with C-terminal beta-propeller domain
MHSFASIGDLKTYLGNVSGYRSFSGGPLDSKFLVPAPMPATTSASQGDGFSYSSSNSAPQESYSTTNIQVAGVDEADTVKTDGQYIYAVTTLQPTYYGSYATSESSNAIYVINADSQNPQVTAKISLGNDTAPAGLFLSTDGTKLTVIASKYQAYNYLTSPAPVPMLYGYQADVYTYINVYDVSNHASPALARNLTVSGSYFNSRMIGNYVYAIISQPAVVYNNDVTLPQVYNDNCGSEISPTSVYYADMVQPSYYEFTSFFGVNIQDDNAQPTNMTVMMGGASTMYVSQDNIYMTYPTWDDGQYTSIYRVSISGADLTLQAQGSVPGNVINQYAMDENAGYFRVATNWYGSSTSNQQINNVYVLDQNLTVVGKLEGLAPDENLHSVRFMGDKVYLVTFKQTDPLFVIDLSQPTNPTVLGELKIPGYSDYLHPYDSTHLIGLGKEAVESDRTDFAWYQGLKLALFDVSNVGHPTQLSNYVVGDRGTTSLALNEPKAFLFDKDKGLLVIPVSLALVDNSTGQARDSSYGTTVWQGAYVFSVSLDGGFTLKGTVTHIDPAQLNSQGHLKTSYSYYGTQNSEITRALYIGNTLYTFSNSMVKLNSLSDMTQTGQINLN